MVALYIIYYKHGFPFLDANTLEYFLQLKKSSKKDFGYVYFSVWPEFNGKNLIFGAPVMRVVGRSRSFTSTMCLAWRRSSIIMQVTKRAPSSSTFFIYLFTSCLSSQLLQHELFWNGSLRRMRIELLIFLLIKGTSSGSWPPRTWWSVASLIRGQGWPQRRNLLGRARKGRDRLRLLKVGLLTTRAKARLVIFSL